MVKEQVAALVQAALQKCVKDGLLPPGEYERGLRFLEREMPRRYGDRFEISARFTFVGATR